MEQNIFWDKNIKETKLKRVLRDESDPEFVNYAALLLSRTNDVKTVFGDYMDKVAFCRNWRKIKQRMRKNKWRDNRIYYWDEVYKVARHSLGSRKIRQQGKKRIPISPELKNIGALIRTARKKVKLTQKELGKKIKISQQSISFIEKGYNNSSLETLLKITAALNLRIAIEPAEESAA